MADPLFWLALSFLLVVISLTAVLMVAIPALRELGRAARSAEKFFDTLGKELPPTLEAIRLTGLEIVELTDDVTEGVQSAGQVAQQVTQSIATAQTGAKRLNTGTKTFLAGARAAWRAWTTDPQPPPTKGVAKPAQPPSPRSPASLQPSDRPSIPAPEGHRSPEAEEHRGDRILPGDLNGPLPQLEETPLNPIPDPGLETAHPAETPKLSPSRSPQESHRRSTIE